MSTSPPNAMEELTPLEQKFMAEAQSRLEELQPAFNEYNRTQLTIQRFLGTSDGKTTANRGGGRARSSTRQGGQSRHDQFLQLVREKPGITIADAAKEMAVEPNYLYRVRNKAKEAGQIRQDGSAHYPADVDPDRVAELTAAAGSGSQAA